MSVLDPSVLRRALAFGVVGAAAMAAVPAGVTVLGLEDATPATPGVPPVVEAAYRDAVALRCPDLPWTVLAGIGRVETNHARLGAEGLAPNGDTVGRIVGPPLDGTRNTMRIADTDGGRLDGDTTFDRAVGPMQFIPTTWARAGLDGNGDGIADPHNLHDAVHAAAAHLCELGAADPATRRRAILRYNRSTRYVDAVLDWAARYRGW